MRYVLVASQLHPDIRSAYQSILRSDHEQVVYAGLAQFRQKGSNWSDYAKASPIRAMRCKI